MADFETGRDTELISGAGVVLRALSPPKIATLMFIQEGVNTQREMAERLDRTPPAVSNYVEELEELPVPLVRKDGSDRWITSEGEEIISLITRLTNNLGTLDLRNVEWKSASLSNLLDDLERYLDPLHTFRDIVAFHVLYAVGSRSSSWFLDDRETVLFSDVVSDVKEWDDSATKKQIRARITKFDASNTIEIDGQQINLTDKGFEQCQLLDQVMQTLVTADANQESHLESASVTIRPDPSLDLPDDDGTVVRVDTGNETLTAAYCADKPVLHLPSTLNVGELIDAATDLGHDLDRDTELELKWMLTREECPQNEI